VTTNNNQSDMDTKRDKQENPSPKSVTKSADSIFDEATKPLTVPEAKPRDDFGLTNEPRSFTKVSLNETDFVEELSKTINYTLVVNATGGYFLNATKLISHVFNRTNIRDVTIHCDNSTHHTEFSNCTLINSMNFTGMLFNFTSLFDEFDDFIHTNSSGLIDEKYYGMEGDSSFENSTFNNGTVCIKELYNTSYIDINNGTTEFIYSRDMKAKNISFYNATDSTASYLKNSTYLYKFSNTNRTYIDTTA